LDNRCWVNCPTSGRSDSYRLRKGFIREVIAYEDFVQYGSEAKCKEAGKFKVEKNMSLKMVM
jgi:ribosome-binding ATPase YchF (GTP1/OBG family)